MSLPIYSKVKAASIGGGIVAIIAFLLQRFAGIDLPADVIAALTVIVTFVLGYTTVERAGR